MKPTNVLAALLLLFLVIKLQAQPTPSKHVILIGIGGLSAEGFQYSQTPVLNNLVSQGVVSLNTRAVMPTVSAPNCATILCGAGPEQHGVTSDNWSPVGQGFEPTAHDADGYFPSIFTLIHKQLPKAATAMFYDWEWLGTYVNAKNITKQQYVQGHVMVTSVAMNYFKNEKPIFTFIYYGLPDEVGQHKGYGSREYFQSIGDIDTEIGKIIAGVQDSEMAKTTTIIVTSDHGGIGTGNGGESMVEIEVPWIISGPGIKKNILLETPNDNTNTAPTIAKILGIKTPAEWIGRPVNEAFSSKTPAPKSRLYIPKPWCSLAEGAFPGPQQIELSTTALNAQIYYTLDGTPPGLSSRKYTSPFTVGKNCILKAVTISAGNNSETIARSYTFIQGIKTAALTTQPNPKYAGSGVSGLFDGLIGSSNPGNKQWMGFEGDDFEVTLDLGEVKPITALGVDVLQLPVNWIFLPSAVGFYASADGVTFQLLNTYYPADADDIRLDGPVMLTRNFDKLSTRYIRIKAVNLGTCPPTHPGEGHKAWLYVSEVEIEYAGE